LTTYTITFSTSYINKHVFILPGAINAHRQLISLMNRGNIKLSIQVVLLLVKRVAPTKYCRYTL